MSLTILLKVALLALIFLLGYFIGLQQSNKQKTAGYEAAVAELKTELVDAGILPAAIEITSISGAVTSVGPDSLEIDAVQVINNPLELPAPIQRRITVGQDTMIIKVMPKTLEEIKAELKIFEAEQKKYDLALQSGSVDAEPPEPPTDVTLTEIELSDIGIGDQVQIRAATSITYDQTFEAAEIQIMSGSLGAPPIPEEPLGEPGETESTMLDSSLGQPAP